MTAPTSSTTPAGWRQGPVAITAASGQVGTALQRRLAAVPNQVRLLGRGDDLATAVADAEVVIHLAGTLQPQSPTPTPPPTWAPCRPPWPPWPAPGCDGWCS